MANLCVLTYYINQDFCDEMMNIVNDENTPANMFYDNDGYKLGYPWLFYMENGNPAEQESVLSPEKSNLQFKATFGDDDPNEGLLSTLKFKLAMYEITGEFLGWYDLYD